MPPSLPMSLPNEQRPNTWSPQPPVDSVEESQMPFPDWGPLPDVPPKSSEEPRPEELQIGLSSKPDEEPRPKTDEEPRPKIEEEPRPNSSNGSGLKSGEEEQRPPKSDEKPRPKIEEEPRPSSSSGSGLKSGEEQRPPKPKYHRLKRPLPRSIASRPKSPRKLQKLLPKPKGSIGGRPKSDQPPLPEVAQKVQRPPPKCAEKPRPKGKLLPKRAKGDMPKTIRGSMADCFPPPAVPLHIGAPPTAAGKRKREVDLIVLAPPTPKYASVSAIAGRGRAKAGLTAEQAIPKKAGLTAEEATPR